MISIFTVCYSDKHFVSSSQSTFNMETEKENSNLPAQNAQTNCAVPGQPASFFRSCLISVLTVCYSGKHFVISSHDSQHFICKVKEKILVACPKFPDKQWSHRSDCFFRSSLISIFTVYYSDKYFVSSGPDNQHFTWKQKKKTLIAYPKSPDKQHSPRSDCFSSLFAILTNILSVPALITNILYENIKRIMFNYFRTFTVNMLLFSESSQAWFICEEDKTEKRLHQYEVCWCEEYRRNFQGWSEFYFLYTNVEDLSWVLMFIEITFYHFFAMSLTQEHEC